MQQSIEAAKSMFVACTILKRKEAAKHNTVLNNLYVYYMHIFVCFVCVFGMFACVAHMLIYLCIKYSNAVGIYLLHPNNVPSVVATLLNSVIYCLQHTLRRHNCNILNVTVLVTFSFAFTIIYLLITCKRVYKKKNKE